MFLVRQALLITTLIVGLVAGPLAARADLVVLQYHHVSDTTPAATSTRISLFRKQLETIRRLELMVVPLETGTRAALAGKDAGSNQVTITFDDAYLSVFTRAAPMLADYGFPYTIFVNTRAVGHPGYMNWDQLLELARREGVTIANHSADHGHLVRRQGEPEQDWLARVNLSLDEARHTLQSRLGTGSPLFAYPYGEFDRALESQIADRGWYGYGQHSGPIGPGSSATRLPRFPMATAYGQPDALKDKLQSWAFPMDTRTLPDGVITENPPRLTLKLPDTLDTGRLTCFASGQGRIPVRTTDTGNIEVQAPEPIQARRFRYNCTYPAGDGRYFWLSQPWLDLNQPED